MYACWSRPGAVHSQLDEVCFRTAPERDQQFSQTTDDRSIRTIKALGSAVQYTYNISNSNPIECKFNLEVPSYIWSFLRRLQLYSKLNKNAYFLYKINFKFEIHLHLLYEEK